MFLLGNFITSNFDSETQQDIIDDVDFFSFPEINPEHGQDAIEAPIDGFMMAASPNNEAGAKALLGGLGQKEAIEAYIGVDPSVVAAVSTADTSGYNALQAEGGRAGRLGEVHRPVPRPRHRSRPSRPNVVGQAIADFISDPSQIDSILATVQEQAQTYTFE